MPEERNNNSNTSQNNSQQNQSEQTTPNGFQLRRMNALPYPRNDFTIIRVDARPLSPTGIDTSFSQASTLVDEPIEPLSSQTTLSSETSENFTPRNTIGGNFTADNLNSRNSQQSHNHS